MFAVKSQATASEPVELRSEKRFEVHQKVVLSAIDTPTVGCHGVITNISERGMRIRSDDSQLSPNDPVRVQWNGKEIFGIVRNSLDLDSATHLGIQLYSSWETFTQDLLAAHAQELACRNQEVRSLTQSAAQRVQEHLNTMVTHIELTLRNSELERSARTYMDRALNSAAELRRLVKDLQALSLLGSEPVAYEEVNCRQLVSEIRSRGRSTGSQVLLTSGWLPTVSADRAKLQAVFESIVDASLAIDDEPQQYLHVSAEETATNVVFAFRRLGSSGASIVERAATTDAGFGQIGLAISQRIVEQHSGRFWTEFEQNRGTVFYISLPKPSSLQAAAAIAEPRVSDEPQPKPQRSGLAAALRAAVRNLWRGGSVRPATSA